MRVHGLTIDATVAYYGSPVKIRLAVTADLAVHTAVYQPGVPLLSRQHAMQKPVNRSNRPPVAGSDRTVTAIATPLGSSSRSLSVPASHPQSSIEDEDARGTEPPHVINAVFGEDSNRRRPPFRAIATTYPLPA